MKSLLSSSLALLVLASASALQAAPVVTLDQELTSKSAYDGYILNNDLVQYGSSAVSSFTATGGLLQGNNAVNVTDGIGSNYAFANPYDGTNDGTGGGVYILFNSGNSETFTFNLNTTASPLGYDISELQSIASWNDSNDADQNLTISYETVASALTATPYTELGNYDNEFPTTTTFGDPNATRTLLTNVGLTNVIGLEFTYNKTTTSNSTLLGEIDVVGSPTLAVPEPSTYALLLAGVVGLMGFRRMRRA